MGVRERRRCWGLWALRPLLLRFRPCPWPCRAPAQPHASRPCFLSTSLHVFLPWFSVPDSLLPSCRCLRASPWTSSPAPSSLGWWPFRPRLGQAHISCPPRVPREAGPGLRAPSPHRQQELESGSSQLPPPALSQSAGPSVHLDFSPFTHPSSSHDAISPHPPPSCILTPTPGPPLPRLPVTKEKPLRPGETPRSPPPSEARPPHPAGAWHWRWRRLRQRGSPPPAATWYPPQCCHGNQDRTERGREREHERSDGGAGLRVPGRQAGADRRRQTGPETPEAGGCQVPKGGICFWSPRWGREGTPWTLCFQWPGPG